MEALLQLDYYLFHLINGVWTAAWLDESAPLWRTKTTWIPLYVVLAGLIVYRLRRRAVWLFLAAGLCVAVADQVSSSIIKPSVERLRPCRNPALEQPANVLIACGGGYSFTSSHATNHFAIALLLVLGMAGFAGRWRYLLLLWAASIGYAQVYVGVHFPLDVICGGLLGCLIGWGCFELIRTRLGET
ncbi:MAG: phosphatase PAP2 family protein [Saprospiraceae bacterium]